MKQVIAGYQQIVPATLIEQLRHFADQAEADRSLCPEQLALIRQQRWFKAFMPTECGGLEMGLPAAVRLEEALAYCDGSVGWTVTLCAGAGLFVGVMDPTVLPAIAVPADACFAGSGQPLGTALARDGGYEISGEWPYATGLPHSTVVTANCRVVTDASHAEGAVAVRSFFFHRDQVDMIADWDTMGLRGTGSHSFRAGRIWVPQSHAFDIAPEAARLPHPVYRYPFIPFSEITLAANMLGMAVGLLESCGQIIGSRSDSLLSQQALHDASSRILDVRKEFYRMVDESWLQHCEAGALSTHMEGLIAQISRQVARVCQSEATRLFPHAGMQAAKPSSVANRMWRDLFTASQHSMLRH